MLSIEPEEFESPFAGILRDARADALLIHNVLSQQAQPPWNRQSLCVEFIDEQQVNASATARKTVDLIRINIGTFEQIFGTMYGLFSSPTFLPWVGFPDKEESPARSDCCDGFPPMPMVRRDGTVTRDCMCRLPNCTERQVAAQLLADIAIQFLLHHEVGHLIAGHCDIDSQIQSERTIRELPICYSGNDSWSHQQLLEIDADAFACHATALVHTCEELAAEMAKVVKIRDSSEKGAAFITYLSAVGALFRILYRDAPQNLKTLGSSHPHPAVRACLVASSALARGMHSGDLSQQELIDVASRSVRNLEDVWSAVALPGQLPTPLELWLADLHQEVFHLFRAFLACRSEFESRARVRRAWDDWAV